MNEPAIDLTGASVLIVDDVPANLDVLSHSLEAEAYNVLVATSGETALKVAEQAEPDLILLDVMMPGIDGFETCRRLKASPDTQGIPVIFLTARGELEGVLEGFQAGGVDYITKPFQKEEVLIRIRTHLERTRLAQELAEKNTELADLNAHLEQKVEERTLELRQKVKELEGKDRIAQHLLTYHTLEETLNLVLEVISEVIELDRTVIYLQEDGALKPVAAIGVSEPGMIVAHDQLEQLDRSSVHREAFAAAQETWKPVNIETPEAPDTAPFALVPILRSDELLGLIEVDNHFQMRPVAEEELQTLASFALQTAVAISDAQVHQDAGRWKDQLDEVLKLEELLEDVNQLDDLVGGRNKDE